MIELIARSYFNILFAVGASCFSILFLGVYFILRKNLREARSLALLERAALSDDVDASDINMIAGDDLFSTQLDLARAFIESGKEQFARKILQNILEDGSDRQQQEARMLLGQI